MTKTVGTEVVITDDNGRRYILTVGSKVRVRGRDKQEHEGTVTMVIERQGVLVRWETPGEMWLRWFGPKGVEKRVRGDAKRGYKPTNVLVSPRCHFCIFKDRARDVRVTPNRNVHDEPAAQIRNRLTSIIASLEALRFDVGGIATEADRVAVMADELDRTHASAMLHTVQDERDAYRRLFDRCTRAAGLADADMLTVEERACGVEDAIQIGDKRRRGEVVQHIIGELRKRADLVPLGEHVGDGGRVHGASRHNLYLWAINEIEHIEGVAHE